MPRSLKHSIETLTRFIFLIKQDISRFVCVCSRNLRGDRNLGLSARLTFARSQLPSIIAASKMGFATHSRLYGV